MGTPARLKTSLLFKQHARKQGNHQVCYLSLTLFKLRYFGFKGNAQFVYLARPVELGPH
jgi:hypothetical protein